jgi:hypothetical protein
MFNFAGCITPDFVRKARKGDLYLYLSTKSGIPQDHSMRGRSCDRDAGDPSKPEIQTIHCHNLDRIFAPGLRRSLRWHALIFKLLRAVFHFNSISRSGQFWCFLKFLEGRHPTDYLVGIEDHRSRR